MTSPITSPPDEVALLLELHHPAQTGVERRQRGRQLVAVQRHARLQAERVPAGQTARDQPRGLARPGQCLPQPDGVLRLHEQLEAVLAGVAGARDQRRDAGDRSGQTGVVLQAVQIGVGERREDARGLGALHGEQRVGVPVVAHLGVEPGRPLGQRVQDDLGVGGVGDDHVLGLFEPIDDQVVQDAAVLAADHGVARPARLHGADVADQREVQQLGRLRAGDGDLTHVRQVEETGAGAHRDVLLALGAVAQRHVPAGEVGHRRAQRAMRGIERGTAQFGTAHRSVVSQDRTGRGRSSPSVIGT